MKTQLSVTVLLFAILNLSSYTSQHAIVTFPPPRNGMNGQDQLGIKVPTPQDQQEFGGCLNFTAGAPTASAQSGRPFTVSWNITIAHASPPGVNVAIRCNPNDRFQDLATGVDINLLNTTVNIPNNASGVCEMQWRWTSLEDGGSYISCSDINVRGAAANQPPAGSPNQGTPTNNTPPAPVPNPAPPRNGRLANNGTLQNNGTTGNNGTAGGITPIQNPNGARDVTNVILSAVQQLNQLTTTLSAMLVGNGQAAPATKQM